MKVEVDTLHAILYKLSMMCVPISGPTNIYGDNMLVIHNTIKSESTLKKNAIANHAICEAM